METRANLGFCIVGRFYLYRNVELFLDYLADVEPSDAGELCENYETACIERLN